MSLRHALTLGILTLACGAASSHAQDSTALRTRNIVGIVSRSTAVEGLASGLQLGREWRAPGSRLGLQLTADFSGESAGDRPLNYSIVGEPLRTASSTSRRLAINFGTAYSLTRGRLQPYLLGGVTVEHIWMRNHVQGTGTLPAESYDWGGTQTGAGVHGGLGLSLRLRGITLFSEVRATTALVGGGGSFARRPAIPFTLGFRF